MDEKYFADFTERDAFKEFAVFTEEEYATVEIIHPKSFKTFQEFYRYFLRKISTFKKDTDMFNDCFLKPSWYIQKKLNEAK